MRVERVFVGAALAVVLLGASAIALTTPGFTRVLVSRTGGAERSGLSPDTTLQLAEQVRRYVTDRGSGPLPQRVDGREAFDARAASHLEDVRSVFSLARVLTSIAAGATAVWLAWCLSRGRASALASGLRAGAVTTATTVVATGLVAVSDFDRFFTGFHALLFESGTWVFSSDDLLIQLFPESFWMTSAFTWAVLALFGGLVLHLLAGSVRGERRARHHGEHDNVLN